MSELFRDVDVGIANEEDCQASLGIQADVDVHSGQLESEQYRASRGKGACRLTRISRCSPSRCANRSSASHNGWSACLHDRSEFLVSRHYEITHIVDRVGGGDSFAGGLIYGLNALPTHRDALEFAVAASCLKHSIPGDFNRFTREEVEQLVKGGGSGRVQR